MQTSTTLLLVALSLTTLGAATLWPTATRAEASPAPQVREIEVLVDGGYQPGRITVTAGERVRLRFIRRDHGPCTREVVFPGLDIRRELPIDVPVVVELPALTAGEHAFRCGMNMIRGTLVALPRQP
jgi:plastocyanin domain-containing protein